MHEKINQILIQVCDSRIQNQGLRNFMVHLRLVAKIDVSFELTHQRRIKVKKKNLFNYEFVS